MFRKDGHAYAIISLAPVVRLCLSPTYRRFIILPEPSVPEFVMNRRTERQYPHASIAQKAKTAARRRRIQIPEKNQEDIRLNEQNSPYGSIEGGALSPSVKTTSVLRRVVLPRALYYVKVHGLEGYVCAFQLATTSSTIHVEAVSGRLQTLMPGDVFLATPGHRESNIVLVGGIPKGGLVPGKAYWMISDSGVVGELITGTPLAKRFLGQVTYLGTVVGDDGRALTLRQFAEPAVPRFKDHRAPLSLILGTGPEVGKTTAGLSVLRAFLAKGYETVIVLKATGTSSVAEIANYQDYGAAQVFDCVDFGLPTTYPSKRKGMERIFDRALDTCLAVPADAVIIECGGDMLAANIPGFLRCMKRRRSSVKVVLAAADPLGAWGATRMLRDIGLRVTLITGPCTDTPASRQRTQSLCKVAAMNMAASEIEIRCSGPKG